MAISRMWPFMITHFNSCHHFCTWSDRHPGQSLVSGGTWQSRFHHDHGLSVCHGCIFYGMMFSHQCTEIIIHFKVSHHDREPWAAVKDNMWQQMSFYSWFFVRHCLRVPEECEAYHLTNKSWLPLPCWLALSAVPMGKHEVADLNLSAGMVLAVFSNLGAKRAGPRM